MFIHYASNISPSRKSKNLPWVVNIQEKKTQFAEEIKEQVNAFDCYLIELSKLVNSKKNKGNEAIKEIFGVDGTLFDNLMVNKYIFLYIIL